MYTFQTVFQTRKDFHSCTMFPNASPQDHFWGVGEESYRELPQTLWKGVKAA